MSRHKHDRHELQTNELAAYLGKINRSIEPYSKHIAVVVGLLIVGGIAWGLYSSKVSGDRSDATLQLIQAVDSTSAEQLSTVSQNYPETAAAAWSRLYQGNAHLAEGLGALYVDREDAEVRLDDARAAFEAAMAGSSDPLLISRANFGIARVAESLGKIDEAINAYRQCVQANESEEMVKQAQRRIDALNDPQTKDFLAWFSAQDFRPSDPSLPPSLPSEKTLPDLPDLDLPELGKGQAGEDGDDKMKDGGLALPDDVDVPAEKSTETEKTKDATETPESDEIKAAGEDAAPALSDLESQPAADQQNASSVDSAASESSDAPQNDAESSDADKQ